MSAALENRRIPNADPAGTAWREAPVAVLPTARRIRTVFNGRTIVDTTDALVLFEHDHLPVYYLPVKDIDASVLVPTDSVALPTQGRRLVLVDRRRGQDGRERRLGLRDEARSRAPRT